jgi:hypothetical protein
MKKLFLILILLLSFSAVVSAQDLVSFGSRTGFGFVPQYTISGGMRFDIDRSVSKTSNQWLIISPQVFMVSGYRFGHEFKDVWGTGMDVKHKIYLKPNSMKPEGFYVQYGVMFQYFSITGNHQYSGTYIEDGVQYTGVFEGEIQTNLYKFGGNFHLGYQWLIGDKVFFDIYTGAGIRISHNNRNEGFDTWYNNSWIDYGYSGTLLDGGFRVGVYF